MMLEKIGKKISFVCFCLILAGCTAYGKETAPYIVRANFSIEENSDVFEVCGIDLYFLNKTEKQVTDLTLCFYLFDSEGEPVSDGKSHIVLQIEKKVDGMNSFSECISLDKYFSQIPEEKYTVDYLYVSKISYADGSSWSDPFGMMAF